MENVNEFKSKLSAAIDLNWLMQLKHFTDDFVCHVVETDHSSFTVDEKIKVILLRRVVNDLISTFKTGRDFVDEDV